MKTNGKLRWRNRRGDNYWYLEDDTAGYGHVIRRNVVNSRNVLSTHYQACGKDESIDCTRLRDAKAFVELSWRKWAPRRKR